MTEPARRFRGARDPAVPRLEPVDRSGLLPLSFPQQRLWFLDQLAPGNPYYNMSTAWRLKGEMDTAALAEALRGVISRHEVLRTRFLIHEGAPAQVICPAWPLELTAEDFSGPDAEERAAEVTAQEPNRPFDLTSGRLLRARLLRLGDSDHVLQVTVHHIACDVWSLDVLERDLWAFYRAAAEQTAPKLSALPVQYGDFSCWQRSWLSPGETEQRLAWWRRYLDGAPLILQLPADHARPDVATYRGASERLLLEAETVAALRRLAEQTSTTLFMVLLAAFQAVIARWSGQRDLLIGVPVAARSRPELENLVGFFVNTLPVRGRLAGDPSFTSLLLGVRQSVLGVLAHQEVPFEALVEDLAPERDLSRNPLVQVVFQLMTTPGSALRWDARGTGTLDGEPWSGRERTSSHFDLSVRMYEAGDELGAEVVYASDLFDRTSIARLVSWLTGVLERVATDSSCLLSELPLTAEGEWRALSTGQPCPAGPPQTLTSAFRAQAARTPEAPALRWDRGELSYGELDRRSGQLAERLRAAGAGPEVVIGLCCDPGAALAVGLWGILKAGSAYMVLDPEYPDQRLAYQVTETRAPLVVTGESVRDRAAAAGVPAIVLDQAGVVTESQGSGPGTEEAPAGPAEADGSNLACVAFTSGSTGRPKGVMVTHDHLVNYVTWCLAELPLGDGPVPLAAPIAFAGSVLTLFGAWTSGRCVLLGTRADPFSWAESAADASFVKITPSGLRYLAGRFGSGCWEGWDCVILASEPIRRRDLNLVSGPGQPAVVSHYGSTETNGSAMWWSDSAVPDADGILGRPAAGSRLLVVDLWGAPVGAGVPGELCVAGRSVARGYWRRPGLTAERFIPDPFGPPGSRMFRTGDLVKWQPDGNLEFLGRVDEQVKVRGFRVEPGEIEAVLEAHPAVRTAAVAARSDASGSERLVAWLLPAGGESPGPEALRAWVRDRLPEYMVPALVVLVDELPLSPTGKLDRARLTEPGRAPAGPMTAADRPRSPAEQAIAKTWADVLGLAEVGVQDNFFALGGHSLLAIRLISEVSDTLGFDYPLTALFENPTVAAMADAMDRERPAGPDGGRP
jgi:amino acid adenylation domain-containing protein